MIETLEQFVAFCKTANDDEIFEAVEDRCSDDVREEVYAHSDPDNIEPFRNAMFNLGFVDY
jgi:hypothetical protein